MKGVEPKYTITFIMKGGAVHKSTKVPSAAHVQNALRRVSKGLFKNLKDSIYSIETDSSTLVINMRDVSALLFEPSSTDTKEDAE